MTKHVGLRTEAMILAILLAFAAAGSGVAQPGSPTAPQSTTGSSLHSAADVATETLNVRDFGARCDGITDDSSAFAAALAHAGNRVGSTVIFPPGLRPCIVSRALVVPDHVKLRAAPGTVILKAAPDNMSKPMLLAVGNDVFVFGLSFDGGGRDHPNEANVIQGFRVSNVTFDHIAERHTHGIGLIMSSGVINGTVRDSTFEDLGNHWKSSHLSKDRAQGVVFCCGTGNHGNAAIDNKFSDIGLDALQFADQTAATVTGNRFALENGQRAVVSSTNFPAAIFTLRVDEANIHDNSVTGAQGSCIDAPALTNSTISHNSLSACGAAGVGVYDSRVYGPVAASDRVIVSDNVISNNGKWAVTPHMGGITLGGEVTNVSLVGNTIFDTQSTKTQKYGIYGPAGSNLTGLAIDPSNKVYGNLISAFGGIISVPDWNKTPAR